MQVDDATQEKMITKRIIVDRNSVCLPSLAFALPLAIPSTPSRVVYLLPFFRSLSLSLSLFLLYNPEFHLMFLHSGKYTNRIFRLAQNVQNIIPKES